MDTPETPIVAIVEEWLSDGTIHWHVYGNIQEAQKKEKEIEAAGNKARFNVIHGNWTWHH